MENKLTDEILLMYGTDYFVTIGEDGIKTAIEAGFSEIISNEQDLVKFCELRDIFGADSRVTIYWGDAKSRMEECIAEITEPITFWLPYAYIYDMLPLIEKHPVKDHVIIVYDCMIKNMELFSGEVCKINPRYSVLPENSLTGKQDIFIACVSREPTE
jgi:hypothetical protein